MNRLVAVSLMALFVSACGGKTTAVITEDGPLVQDHVEKDRPLTWRRACCKLMGKPAPGEADVIPIGEEKDPNMASCLKGFMAMESERAAEASKCVMGAKDEEAAFWCLESGQDSVPLDPQPPTENP